MITSLYNEILNDTEMWAMLDNVKNINKQLLTYGTLEATTHDILYASNKLLLKEKIHTYCHEPITKNIRSSKTDLFFCINENGFLFLENSPKAIAEFQQKGYLYSRLNIQNLISKNKIGAELSEYYGLFNTIFNNEKIGDFVFEYLNDDGKDAYTKIYDAYKKYNFDKDIIVRKNIQLSKGEKI